ncbi:MAG: phage scaffolding protein [Prevotella sp.]|nr:phage scaffolding protein [Staphylococcus sp.]MCM1349888.1 phage scaffolding protein [Prevotella sp.]
MSLENLKQVLGEELYKTISSKFEGKDYFFAEGKDYVPKARFDEVNENNKELRNQIASRDSQLVELQKAAKGNEELTKQIAELQAANTKAKEEHDAKVLQMQKDYTLESVLGKSGAKNANALKGMLDLSKCEFKDGKYTGLDEQIAQIKKDNDWLFNNQVPKSVGSEHGKQVGGTDGKTDEFAAFRNL